MISSAIRRGSSTFPAVSHTTSWLGRETQQPGHLQLFIEPNDRCLVDNADNLVISPWGDLLLAEDGLYEQYLVGVMPDGTALFVNIQHSGLTLAIFGPWAKAADQV